MPYCTQCGTLIGDKDVFCGSCGGKQGGGPAAAPAPAGKDFLRDLNANTAALLCYIPWIGWIASVVVLATARFRDEKEARFHAFQGLYLFVAWLLVHRVVRPVMRHWDFPFVPFVDVVGLLELALFGACIFMIVKVSQKDNFRLPFFGELAEKSVAEQR
ncbi:MAG: hypothetical protein SFV51_25300 [Bryobacteraceae bacterium]|nr:hypothetical protein [Bryobacteraceae bacterium]